MNTLSSQERFAYQNKVKELISRIEKNSGRSLLLEGFCASAKAYAVSIAAKNGIHVILLNNREEALFFAADLYSLIGKEEVFFFPSSSSYSIKGKTEDPSYRVQRTAAIDALKNYSERRYKYKNLLLVAYPHSISEKVITKKGLNSRILTLSVGNTLSHEFIKETLMAFSFIKTDFVTEPGEFALRGSIIDIFSFSEDKPYRIDFFGDNIESIKIFDIDSQRSIEAREGIDIYPDIHKEEEKGDEQEDIFSFIKETVTLWIDDSSYFKEQIDLLHKQGGAEERPLTAEEFEKVIIPFQKILFAPEINPSKAEEIEKIAFHTIPQPAFNKNFDLLAKDIAQRREEEFEVYILSKNPNQIDRLKSILSSYEKEGETDFRGEQISVHGGFVDYEAKICEIGRAHV